MGTEIGGVEGTKYITMSTEGETSSHVLSLSPEGVLSGYIELIALG
jgi:hypothetical protein